VSERERERRKGTSPSDCPLNPTALNCDPQLIAIIGILT
jgi:hypothetical protein